MVHCPEQKLVVLISTFFKACVGDMCSMSYIPTTVKSEKEATHSQANQSSTNRQQFNSLSVCLGICPCCIKLCGLESLREAFGWSDASAVIASVDCCPSASGKHRTRSSGPFVSVDLRAKPSALEASKPRSNSSSPFVSVDLRASLSTLEDRSESETFM